MYHKIKRLKRVLVQMLVIVMIVTMAAGCAATPSTSDGGNPTGDNTTEKGTIEIGIVNWAECVAASNLWKVILEDQGYKVNLTQLDAAPLYVGLDKGDLDFFLDAWLPITHEVYWEKYKDNLDDYGIWYTEDAKIGVVVPQYVTISSIEELKANKDKFNGEIIGIDPGAGIMKASNAANEDYDLGFKVVQGSEAAMMAAMKKAYDSEQWIAITGWSPHWKFAQYDLKYLEDPNGSYGEAEQIHTLANKEFTTKNPDVAEMLKKFKMSDAQIGSLEALIVDGMDPLEAAEKWMTDNQDVVKSWIE